MYNDVSIFLQKGNALDEYIRKKLEVKNYLMVQWNQYKYITEKRGYEITLTFIPYHYRNKGVYNDV